MVEAELKELKIIEEFLPPQLAENEIQTRLQETITAIGETLLNDMGKVMGKAMSKFKGKADGSIVQKIAKDLLDTINK